MPPPRHGIDLAGVPISSRLKHLLDGIKKRSSRRNYETMMAKRRGKRANKAMIAWCFAELVRALYNKMEGTESRNDHTIMTAPLPVCSAKLSIIWFGEYYGGGPRWKTKCCSFVPAVCLAFTLLKAPFRFHSCVLFMPFSRRAMWTICAAVCHCDVGVYCFLTCWSLIGASPPSWH